jgi:hypothetical protein
MTGDDPRDIPDLDARSNDDLDEEALVLDDRRSRLRLKIDRNHPERTVADLRDILAKSCRLYDRGAPVRVVFDQTLGGSVAHPMTADSLGLEAHFACQPYTLACGAKDVWAERDAPLPPQIARMYLGWRGEWNLPPLNGVTTTPLLSEDGSIRSARGYDAVTGLWCERVPDVVFIRWQSRGELPPHVRDALKAAKSEIVALLRSFRLDETDALDATGQTGDAELLAKLAALDFRVRRYGAQAALDDDTGQGRFPPMPLLYEFAERQREYGALLRALQAPDMWQDT